MSARLLSVLRVVAALLYLSQGTQKLFGFPGDSAPVAYFSLPGLAGGIEIVCGALLLVGLWTRPVAFVAATEMLITALVTHHGALTLLFSALFLYMGFVGPGAWSLDRRPPEAPDLRTTGARRFR